MTTIAEAARAVARVAKLLEPAGSRYVRGALSLTPTGDYAKSRNGLAIDLEWLTGAPLRAFSPERAAAINEAAAVALAALPDQIDERFFTELKTALADNPNGGRR